MLFLKEQIVYAVYMRKPCLLTCVHVGDAFSNPLWDPPLEKTLPEPPVASFCPVASFRHHWAQWVE